MALICNLVQEFNGLVSKGSTAMLALLLLQKIFLSRTHFKTPPLIFHDKKSSLVFNNQVYIRIKYDRGSINPLYKQPMFILNSKSF